MSKLYPYKTNARELIVKSILVLLVCMFVGCNKSSVTSISPVAANISFNVNWQYVSKNSSLPKALTVWLYPRKGSVQEGGKTNLIYGHPLHLTVVTEKTVSIELEAGVYDLIAYNADDLKKIKAQDVSDYYKHRCVVEEVDKNNNTLEQADFLHTLVGNTVRSLDVKAGVPLTVTLNPKTVTKSYNVNINVISKNEIKDGTASLQGVASYINFYNGIISSEQKNQVVFPIAPQLSKAGEINSSLTGTANVLGTAILPNVKNELNVVINYVDNSLPQIIVPTIDLTNDITENPEVSLDVNVNVDVSKGYPNITVDVRPYTIVQGEDIVIEPTA